MDGRDRVIGTQVAFKGAVDLCHDLDLVSPEGQVQFTQVFSFLQDSLVMAMTTGDDEARAAQVIRGNFPGTVTEPPPNTPYVIPQQATPQEPGNGQQWVPQQQVAVVNGGQLRVKGDQYGPLPDWLWEAAAAKGVVEVWDNRNKAMGTKRPWFRSTSGGDDAPAFWPPK